MTDRPTRPTLFLLPGTMCTELLWAPVMTRLAAVCEPVFLPVPMAPDLDATIDALAERIDVADACVAGFSLGGYLAAELAVRQPGRIGRLMLVASTPCPLVPAERAQRRAAIEWVRAHGYKGLSRTKARQLTGGEGDVDAIVETVMQMDAALGEPVFLHQMAVTTERRDLADGLGERVAQGLRLTCASAAEDPLLDHEWRERFATQVPRTAQYLTAGRAHLLPLTHPDWIADLMIDWVRS